MRSRMWSSSASVMLGRVMMIMSRSKEEMGENEKRPVEFPRVAGMVRGAAVDSTAYASNYGP